MHDFRKRVPQRRKNPRNASNYKSYKVRLREDFNERCGYCDDHDKKDGGMRSFHIDHFAPKKHLKEISENDYNNLTYACFYCNNAKGADWPTNDEKISNDGKRGYIDACDPEYDRQFHRDDGGKIVPNTDLGQYIYQHLNLYLERHSIIWMLERLQEQIDELSQLNEIEEKFDTKEALFDLLKMHYKFSKLLEDER